MANQTGPIADLTYRTYDGVLFPPAMRWWVIAKMSMRMAIKKKGFWIWACLSGYWYFILSAIFYFADTIGQRTVGGKNPILAAIVWKDQFLTSFSMAQMFLLIITLLIGAGSIAGDNKANALLVYLSKPCTKLDYLIGKWFGIFIPIALVTLAPMLLFYSYCLMSYRDYGFVSQDPWLILQILLMAAVPGFFHASLVIGVSSMFNQGRLAGATYAAIYFLSNFGTIIFKGLLAMSERHGDGANSSVLTNLFYCSIDGVNIGMAKVLLNSRGSLPIPGAGQGGRNFEVDVPNALFMIFVFIGVSALAMLVAWRKVRAVEVVGS